LNTESEVYVESQKLSNFIAVNNVKFFVIYNEFFNYYYRII